MMFLSHGINNAAIISLPEPRCLLIYLVHVYQRVNVCLSVFYIENRDNGRREYCKQFHHASPKS